MDVFKQFPKLDPSDHAKLPESEKDYRETVFKRHLYKNYLALRDSID